MTARAAVLGAAFCLPAGMTAASPPLLPLSDPQAVRHPSEGYMRCAAFAQVMPDLVADLGITLPEAERSRYAEEHALFMAAAEAHDAAFGTAPEGADTSDPGFYPARLAYAVASYDAYFDSFTDPAAIAGDPLIAGDAASCFEMIAPARALLEAR